MWLHASLPPRLLTLVLSLCMLAVAPTANADLERSLDDPTAWWWLYGATEAQVSDIINDEGARLVDIEVESVSPLRFNAAFVHNSGGYASGWWWYYNATTTDISNLLTANTGRLIDIERYSTVGGDRFAVIMVSNTGANAKSWWWYVGQTPASLSTAINTNAGRLVDLDGYTAGAGAGRLYDAIMIHNSGSDFSNWSWLLGQTGAQVSAFLASNNDRILDIDPFEVGGTYYFDIVTKDNPSGQYWWWWYNQTAAQVVDLINQHGARIADIETYFPGGQRRFAVMMLNNSNDLTTNIATQLGYGSDGVTGFYLRSLSDGVLANINEAYKFEPASTIKVILHYHAMRQVMLGNENLGNNVNYSINYNGSCPIGGAPFTNKPLSGVLSDMMYFSDNAATNAIALRYGAATIENTAQLVAGMADTELNHTLGCGPPGGNPALYNQLTLVDSGELYEGVANGSLLNGFARDQFYALMQSDLTPVANQWWLTSDIRNLIFDEATNLGIPNAASSYWAETELAWKPGGYTLCWPNCLEYRSATGWISLPQCDGRSDAEEYVFGLFIHEGTNFANADNRLFNVTKELLRDEVREGLLSCPTDVPRLLATRDSPVWLAPNVPNPFNPSTELRLRVETPGHVRLTIYDQRGRVVDVLRDEWMEAGGHSVPWDGTDASGASVASGSYFVRAESAGGADVRKVALIK